MRSGGCSECMSHSRSKEALNPKVLTRFRTRNSRRTCSERRANFKSTALVPGQPIADAAHGLQVDWLAWIPLDLAAKAGHLHINRTLDAGRGQRRQLLPRDWRPGASGQDRKKLRLALRQAHQAAVAA